ncbi:MAG: hypothetical protein JW712_04180 [Dehalococcoidales bacterium]|nr:hypothetical protein [Dehalococcoidales bacterium]
MAEYSERIKKLRDQLEKRYGKTPEQIYSEREKRLEDALHLKQPDRIPIHLMLGYFTAEWGGISNREMHENPEKVQEILEDFAMEHEADSITGAYSSYAEPHIMLGDRMTAWPGHQLGENGQFQFVEHEFMKAEDYDEFLEDPVDWSIRTYLPRGFSELGSFASLPPLGMTLFGCYHVFGIAQYANPDLVESFRKIAHAAQMAADRAMITGEHGQRMIALGYPANILSGALLEAPYDFMSDTLRGMRGIMMDMLKRPDKLLAAQEKVSRIELKSAVQLNQVAGVNRALLPLHRGSDGFMSLPQFEKFYWPQLKELMLNLIDNGIMPGCFYEGVWDQRLKYLAELPKGKTFGMFQSSDIFKVKEVLGDTMCIIGGMPNSLLQNGTVDEVKAYTKRLCTEVGKGGGYIMSTGVGEMSGAKPELVKAWIEAANEYGVY